jgi:hypothetical protein
MKTQSILKVLAATISLGFFALMSCTPQSTVEVPALESSVEASAPESLSVTPPPQTSSNRQTMSSANTKAFQVSNPYIGMWVTEDGYIPDFSPVFFIEKEK